MNRMTVLTRLAIAAGVPLFASIPAAYAAPISVPLAAEYLFDNTLNSDNGAPALTATDPLGTASFSSDTVFGQARTVYNFTGAASPVTDQGGLTLDTTGLLSSNATWSAEVDLKFNEKDNAWRRIIDVQNRTSDAGFYVDPSNHLDVFPVAGTTDIFTTGDYYKAFISVDNGTVTVWLGTSTQFSFATTVMAIDNPDDLMNLFLDNTAAGGQGEWSSGSIAYFGLYDGALNDDDVALLSGRTLPVTPPPPPRTPGVPEPATLALFGAGLVGLGIARKRRNVAK